MLGGDTLKTLAPQTQLTAFVGGSLVVFGKAGPAGVSLIAPVVAGKLITYFLSISLSHILGKAGSILGDGVGAAVGIPLDLSLRLLGKVCSVIGGYMGKEASLPKITGIRIKDGKMAIAGVALELVPVGKLPEDSVKQVIEFKEDGSIHVDGKKVNITKDTFKLPTEVIDELQAFLDQCTNKKNLKAATPMPKALEVPKGGKTVSYPVEGLDYASGTVEEDETVLVADSDEGSSLTPA